MLCARLLRLFYLTLLVLSAATVLAQEKESAQDGCDWYCWAEGRINSLQQQIDKIEKYLFPGNNNNNQLNTLSDDEPSTHTLYPSPFGTPYVSPSSFYAYEEPTSSNVVVTVSSTPTSTSTPSESEPESDVQAHPGYRALGYYGNWDIYARKFFPQQIPASKLTHLLYSFADNKPDGTVFLTDTYADTDKHYTGDSWDDTGKNVYGSIKQLQLLKASNRNLKVMLSIGGWTYTNQNKHMDTPVSTEAGQATFAASCVQLVKDYGFDGIDVDWEYPQDATQGGQFLALLKEIRGQLDAYADTLVSGDDYGNETKPHFLLSIAAPAGEVNYRNLPLGEIVGVLDFVNLMAYDYAGSWDTVTGHSSNLYPSLSNPPSTPFNTLSVVNAYLAAGVPAGKLNLGMPLYGRAFTNTAGLGLPYDGVGDGSWEKGVYDFKALPLAGATEYYDAEAGATYSYDNSTKMLVSYDTVGMALTKVDFIKKNGLGGAMWWEVSGDRNDTGSIISNVVESLGGNDGSGVESSPNWLSYPDSQFDNIKKGFAS